MGTQEKCDQLFADLLKAGYPCLSLHGGKVRACVCLFLALASLSSRHPFLRTLGSSTHPHPISSLPLVRPNTTSRGRAPSPQDQLDRDHTLHEFKRGIKTVMVATSVAGRGLDVPEIVVVVNYHCPNHLEDYVHRVGRTGRAGRKGTAYTFVSSQVRGLATALSRSRLSGPCPVRSLPRTLSHLLRRHPAPTPTPSLPSIAIAGGAVLTADGPCPGYPRRSRALLSLTLLSLSHDAGPCPGAR